MNHKLIFKLPIFKLFTRGFSIVSLYTLIITSLVGQNDKCVFKSPVNHQIISSGSFGEPRSSHFHSGVDIKPHLGRGKDEILAIGDGYISRIIIVPDGYGRAVYIDHPCGYTSVYAHLHSFSDTIQEYIDKVRIATKQSEIDQNPPPNALRVRQGDVLGTMGNSGNSFGAHLHFEIRNTKSEVPVNPVFFGIGPKDNIAPVIKGLIVYELDLNKKPISQKYYRAKLKENDHYQIAPDTLKLSWPNIGYGLHVYDTSNGAGNHNGIHKLKTSINGYENFSFSIDSVPFDKSIFLHAHMDYQYKKNNQYVHKCYKEDLNTLDIYELPKEGHLHIPNEIIPDHIKITAADIYGNLATLYFLAQKSVNSKIVTALNNEGVNLQSDKNAIFRKDSFRIIFSPGTFLHPQQINLELAESGIKIFNSEPITPLFKDFEIQYFLNDQLAYQRDKLTFTTVDYRGRIINLGATTDKNVLSVHTNNLGEFRIIKDDIAPLVKIVSNKSQDGVNFRAKDNLKSNGKRTRIKYNAHIGGQWVPVDYDEKNDLLHISTKWIKVGSKGILSVSDFNQNKTEISFTIK